MHITEKRTQFLLAHLQEKHYAEWCSHYGEPGYSDPERGVLFADWNPVPRWIGDYLTEAGFGLEWSDEWAIDCDNSKAYRTSPDSWGWQSSIVLTEDGHMLTPDDDAADVIAALQMDGPTSLCARVPHWISDADLQEAGFALVSRDYESGFHPGQNDNPREIAKALFAERDVLAVTFRVDDVRQFDARFSAWVKRDGDKAVFL